MLLTPRDPLLGANPNALARILSEVGFIDAPLPGQRDSFLAGGHFLGLITFAGCSVQVELAPPPDGSRGFCHVRFKGPYERTRLLHGRNTRPPRCRSCRAPHKDWQTRLLTATGTPTRPLACPACGAEHMPWDWDWKGNAGFGRFFVQVEEIFPGEATPTTALTGVLEQATGAPWRHFYVQDR